jgi:ATP-dependent exoDNAse (exonuclease V) alpha subunit
MAARGPGKELTEIRRQEEPWARQAVKDMAAGRAREALAAYAEKGLLQVEESREQARAALLEWWKERGGVGKPQEHLILTGTRLDTAILNRMAQAERRREGHLGARSVSLPGDTVYEGDQVLFTRKSRLFGVENGTLATVVGVDPKERVLRVRLDTGERTRVPLDHYDHLQLGYALTTHKGQGCTVENAYILVGGGMQDRELSTVQVSRARGQTWIFTDRAEAGEGLTQLARQMSTSHQKELALDLAQRAAAAPRLRDWNTPAQPQPQPQQQRDHSLSLGL